MEYMLGIQALTIAALKLVRSRFALLCGIASVLVVLAIPHVSAAADRYKQGDEVEVLFLGEWRPGKVVTTNKQGAVMADFVFISSERKVFSAEQVRFPFEAGALARSRPWSDSSGGFRTEGALLSLTEKEITLRKPDKTEIKVPIEKLSTKDRAFLKKFAKAARAASVATVQPPPLEQFAEAGWAGWSAAERNAIEPDPVPGYLKLKEGGTGFPINDFFDRMGAVLPVGGPDGWLLGAIENDTPGAPLASRLVWCSLARNKIENFQLLPPGEVVLDYHPPSHRLLTCQQVRPNKEDWGISALSLWEVVPKDQEVKPIVRWRTNTDVTGIHAPWARLINGDLVLHRWNDSEFVCWDTANKKMVYRINQESFFGPDPTLTGGRKYVLMPEDSQVRIFECATGKVVSTLPTGNRVAAVAVTPDGRRAAVLGQTELTVWDLADATVPHETFQAESIGTPFTSILNWIGDDRVMADVFIQGQVLFSLSHKVPLWNYKFDSNAVSDARGRRVREITDNHIVYAASTGTFPQRGLAIGAVRLPGPRVDEAAAALNVEPLYIIKPGTEVSLVVQAGSDSPAVQAALERKIAENGWILNPNAKTVMTAEMGRGESRTTTFVNDDVLRGRQEQTVTITPYVSTIRIDVNGTLAWQSGTSTGSPFIVWVKPSESVQSKVDEWHKPSPEFFSSVIIPPNIFDPAKRYGIGATAITNRGFILQ